MLVYVLFALVSGYNTGMTTFVYEFKDKAQCENLLRNLDNKIVGFVGFCQEVRK